MPKRRLHVVEFVALMALLASMVAFSTDAMLPALPQIAADLTPGATNRAQMIIGAFMLGLGLGTFFAGPLADAFGRRIVVIGGIALFVLGAGLAYRAQSLELVLAARILQGIGAAGPRIAPLAMIRDLFQGRQMARILSFVTVLFMLVPAMSPAVGLLIIDQWGWRAIFIAFGLFAGVGLLWFGLRQPETLAPRDRRPLRWPQLKSGFLQVVTNRMVMVYALAMTLEFAILVAILSSTQQVYAQTFGRADSFAFWFALTALMAMAGTFLNATLVVRFGMRRLVLLAFGVQGAISLVVALIFVSGMFGWAQMFGVWFFWTTAVFFSIGMIFGNLMALAMQPLGHIAGMGASMISAISTVLAVFIGGPLGLAFDGTPLPLVSGVAVLAALACLLLWRYSVGEPEASADEAR